MLAKLLGALLVTYAVSATVALVAWRVSYGIRGVPVVHDAEGLLGAALGSILGTAIVGAIILLWLDDTETEEEKLGGRD